MDKAKLKKYVLNFALFVLLIIITFWIIFKDQDISLTWETIKNSNWTFILIGTLSMFTFLSVEALNIRKNVKTSWRKIKVYKQFKIFIHRIFL